jgi:arylsulfatase A-like enzyme
LSCYGYHRPTSPFLDSLAREGLLFENLFVQIPGTLPSHMSIFTGLYPAEHGTYPGRILPDTIPTVAEVLRDHGFRTAGFTEGGMAAGRFGFSRGFEIFSDEVPGRNDDVELTFERGMKFLETREENQRFFLFLHTYAVHTPYDPPEPYTVLYWKGPPPDAPSPVGPNLIQVNRGTVSVSEAAREYYEALYDGSINYVDDVLKRFFVALEELHLRRDTIILITSDHGEEFLEHGRLLHEQVYPETLHVPLLLLHPELEEGRSISSIIESVDIAPTLYDLVGIAPPDRLSGRSFASSLFEPEPILRKEAYAEAYVSESRALIRKTPGGLYHFIRKIPEREPDGLWVTREVRFDVFTPKVSVRVMSYYQPRTVEIRVDGELVHSVEVGTGWEDINLHLPKVDRKATISISTDDCVTPAEVGHSEDKRCLSFKLQAPNIIRTALYDLSNDPDALQDLSEAFPELRDQLLERLQSYEWTPAARAERIDKLPEDLRRRLEALGYVH